MNQLTRTLDTTAKLLATENIDVVRTSAKTASFDMKNRVVFLPNWKDITPELEEMLIMHEVGHALETKLFMEVATKEPKLKAYFNVVEDARIEALMKNRYPGSRKTFMNGYKQLMDRDFFGISTRNIAELILIDRINLYFKLGLKSGVKFSPVEMKFVTRISSLRREADGYDLAREIYEFSKKQRDDITSDLDMHDIFQFDENDDEGDDYFQDYEESESGEDGEGEKEVPSDEDNNAGTSNGGGDDANEDERLEPITQNSLDSKLTTLADGTFTVYYDPKFRIKFKQPTNQIESYQDIIKNVMNSGLLCKPNDCRYEQYKKFKASSTKMVNYLVKEFEMKKSATNYRRAKQAKTGSLDPKKLATYKLRDDIFRQITRVQDGKKHSMLFLLDWSGSMQINMHETIEQLINLVMFCRRVDIPFQVLAFTDINPHRYAATSHFEDKLLVDNDGIGREFSFYLLELFSDKMTNVEFNKMMEILHTSAIFMVNDYRMNGTPLADSLVYMVDYVGKFIENTGAEKPTFIVLTDGDSSAADFSNKYDRVNYASRASTRHVLRDPMTRREYNWSGDSTVQCATLLKVISDRYGCPVLRFFITYSNSNDIRSFVNSNYISSKYYHNKRNNYEFVEKAAYISKKLRSDKYVILNDVPGCDALYVLNAKNMKVEDKEVEVNKDMSSAAIARKFTNAISNNRHSRVVLDHFISQVS